MDQVFVLEKRAGRTVTGAQSAVTPWEGMTKGSVHTGASWLEGRSAQKDLKVDSKLTMSQPGPGVPRVGISILGCRIC